MSEELRAALATLADTWEAEANERVATETTKAHEAANLLAAGILRSHAQSLRAALPRPRQEPDHEAVEYGDGRVCCMYHGSQPRQEDRLRARPCRTCNGDGWVAKTTADPLPSGEPGEPYQIQDTCPDCGGSDAQPRQEDGLDVALARAGEGVGLHMAVEWWREVAAIYARLASEPTDESGQKGRRVK